MRPGYHNNNGHYTNIFSKAAAVDRDIPRAAIKKCRLNDSNNNILPLSQTGGTWFFFESFGLM
jgi:hypothetical protein